MNEDKKRNWHWLESWKFEVKAPVLHQIIEHDLIAQEVLAFATEGEERELYVMVQILYKLTYQQEHAHIVTQVQQLLEKKQHTSGWI